jgi:dolichyl-phosphate beta-glucosyltransferase
MTPESRASIALSIIIPTYNETHRLPPYLQRISEYCKGRRLSHEILVVDDGSRDGTVELVEKFRAEHPEVRLLRLLRNTGKGAAVRTGIREANGGLRLIADADGAAPIQEFARLEAAVDAGADIAIGSRFLGSHDHRFTVRARWHRSVFGRWFNLLVQSLGIAGISDTQCGFKLFRDSVARDLFSVSRVNGYGYDLEILFVSQRRGYRIAEVPINWTDQPGSKVHVVSDGWRTFKELLAVRRNHARGLYDHRRT